MRLLNQKLPPCPKNKVSEMVVHILIPELWEQRQEDSCVTTLCSPLGKLHNCERPCLETKVDRPDKWHPRLFYGLTFTHRHTKWTNWYTPLDIRNTWFFLCCFWALRTMHISNSWVVNITGVFWTHQNSKSLIILGYRQHFYIPLYRVNCVTKPRVPFTMNLCQERECIVL